MPRFCYLAFCILCSLFLLPVQAQQLDTTKFAAMKARSIGPAGMSGRVTSFDVVLRDPNIIYAGTASGGLWKSTSGGIGWEPIFDDQPAASIGAVAVYQKNPDIVWVGTGEGNPRNSQTNGNGVYKSLDGGKTWTHLGLEDSRNIHRLIIHPDNPDVVYVGAQGPAWGVTEQRGVFKTTDGGQTWNKILYNNERTGIADFVMDPDNPNKLIAAMWDFRRWPWFFESGGEGSGLYVTFDSGATWTKRTEDDGLPAGDLGRMGLAIAPSNPNVVYAYVEAKKDNALYRSDDGGFTWKKTKNEGNAGNRPFYYADIYVDPQNENRVYSIHSIVTYSEDGGDSFETLIPYSSIHPDHHAWWIHPDNPDFMLDGNDGGMAITQDRGKTWRFVENLPLAQFYHINADMDVPYNVYGGMQDNGSWKGPSAVWRSGGIRNSYWEEVAFGDGFDVMPVPNDDRYLYAMSQGGNLRRTDLVSGEQKNLKPIHPDDVALRFNWNAAIAQDPFDPETIYYGSQFVHKSTDRGDSWSIISPDLTTDDPEKQRQIDSGGLTYDVTQAENFTTIMAIAPSPVQQGVMWVGTDDGNVQVTTDGGTTWTNVVKNIKGVAEGAWVPQIRASTYRAGEAFVVFDDHRRNNWEPYAYHTADFGQTWTRLADENDVWGYALSIAQDPIEPNLLFLGTEFGLYVSIDGGDNWTKWTQGFPTVSTMDLMIHPRDHDLVIGTFGRAAYILDDIRPLRALAQEQEGVAVLDKPLHVFDAPDAYLASYAQATGTRFAGDAIFAGENRPYGALITYSLNPEAEDVPEEEEEGVEADTAEMDDEEIGEGAEEATPKDGPKKNKVRIEVLDGTEVIRTMERDAEPGINRFAWSLERKGVRFPTQPKPRKDAPERGGAQVLPGTYTVRISYRDQVEETTVNVNMDPRIKVSQADLQAQQAMMDRLLGRVAVATEAVDRLRASQKTIKMIADAVSDREDEAAKTVKKEGTAMQDSIKTLIALFNGDDDAKGIRRDPTTVSSRIFGASSYVQSVWGAPDPSAEIALSQVETHLQNALADVNQFYQASWPTYQQAVEAANVEFFETYEPLRLDAVMNE